MQKQIKVRESKLNRMDKMVLLMHLAVDDCTAKTDRKDEHVSTTMKGAKLGLDFYFKKMQISMSGVMNA